MQLLVFQVTNSLNFKELSKTVEDIFLEDFWCLLIVQFLVILLFDVVLLTQLHAHYPRRSELGALSTHGCILLLVRIVGRFKFPSLTIMPYCRDGNECLFPTESTLRIN